MTLNITVVGATGIHQSADLRLTAFKAGPDGRWIPIEDNSPKVLSLRYKNWGGYLTYCGVGKWDREPTYVSATEWITSLGSSPTFHDVVRALQERGSTWIAGINSRTRGFQGHTFILAGYERGVRRIAIVSNTHSTEGRLATSSLATLQVSVGGQSGTHVYVTGLDRSVPLEERAALKRLAKKQAEANVLRHRLAQINANAAGRSDADNGISASCLCYSIDHLGAGAGEVYGPVVGPLVPVHIINGLNITQLVESQISGPGSQMRASTVSTSESSKAANAEHIDCALDLKPTAAFDVVGHDLGDINARTIEISAANRQGSIVGRLYDPVGAPHRAFMWIGGQKPLDLGTLGGSASEAADVNNAHMVVGASVTTARKWMAFAWCEETGMVGLGTMDANSSVAAAVNDQGTVVGCIYRTPSTPRDEYHRAFRWSASEGMQFVPGTEKRWSSGLDINTRGEILVACSNGPHVTSGVWSERGLRLIQTREGRPFHGSSINDSGTVVGTADDNNGVRKTMLWTVDGGLQQLPVPASFHPRCIDNEGNIVGQDSRTPWAGAWLLQTSGMIMSLPGGSNRNLDALQIVGRSIYGHARGASAKHVHPIRWDLSLRVTPDSARN